MSIRNFKKDNFSGTLISLEDRKHQATKNYSHDDPLIFWTKNTKNPCLINLREFSDGAFSSQKAWGGDFTGRPLLIAEIISEIKRKYEYAPYQTSVSLISALRTWWRLFDAIDSTGDLKSATTDRLNSMADLSLTINQYILDSGMDVNCFHTFVSIVNAQRRAFHQQPLNWIPPEARNVLLRKFPKHEHVARIWYALKRPWFDCLHRLDQTRLLLKLGANNIEEQKLLENYVRFVEISENFKRQGIPFPDNSDLRGNLTALQFKRRGYAMNIMLDGFYPNARDIRSAFHLCLATTGFNPQTVLEISVDVNADAENRIPGLTNNPKDPSRFILWANKNRGSSTPSSEGLWRTTTAAGPIIKLLVDLTWPIRQKMVAQFTTLEKKYTEAKQRQHTEMELRHQSDTKLDEMYKQICALKYGITSVWIYPGKFGPTWLKPSNYNNISSRDFFLKEIIDKINKNQMERDQVPVIVATDFRDAFSYFAYKRSGGQVLEAKEALQHRSLKSIKPYLKNSIIQAESRQAFKAISDTLWQEIRIYNRLDPTLLAKIVRQGKVAQDEVDRLDQYRKLRKSRLGIACADPSNPPQRFKSHSSSNEQKHCTTHRCILCHENAIILPESLPGIAMRFAELTYLKSRMPIVRFISSSFEEELYNASQILLDFDATQVDLEVKKWADKITCGQHRVIEFFG
jgi:hypothetical protein